MSGLETRQGSDRTSWANQPGPITFAPGVLKATMDYSNRPTFQQVLWFGNRT